MYTMHAWSNCSCIDIYCIYPLHLEYSHFAKLATSIAIKDVSAPETFDLKNYFPDFLWLLRDAILMVPPGRDGKPMTPTDYLKTKVLKRGSSFEETANDKIGRAILTVFPTIECMTIQPPSANPEVMQNIVANQDYLEPRFNEQICCLIEYLLQHVRPKNGFVEGKLVDGPLLAAMATGFLEAVNDPDAIPCITDTWQAAVEIRCKRVLNQMLQEYTQEMEVRIAEVGLPMEEDSLDGGDKSKPCTLLGLHRSTLLQKTEFLLQQVGHFVGGPAVSAEGVMPTCNRESLSAELERCTAVFEEDAMVPIQGQNFRKKKVIGGVLFKFAQRNHLESRSHCLALFAELYMRIEEKIQKGDSSYTFEKLSKDLTGLQEEYYQRAIGPAKWEVYTEKESFIKSQEQSYERLRGYKKEAFDALQKAAEEKAKNDRLNDSLNELQTQMRNDAELNQKRMETMQKQHQDEMQRLHKEQEERMENDRIKYEDFMKAQIKEMAEITKENREDMKQQYDAMFKSMEAMNQQSQEGLKAMNESVAAMKTAIENMRKLMLTNACAGTIGVCDLADEIYTVDTNLWNVIRT